MLADNDLASTVALKLEPRSKVTTTFVAVLCPVAGPRLLHFHRPSRSSGSSYSLDMLSAAEQESVEWLMRFVMRDSTLCESDAKLFARDFVKCSVKTISVPQLQVVVICLLFRELPFEGEDEFAQPTYAVCYCLDQNWQPRLQAVLPSLYDRLLVLLSKILRSLRAMTSSETVIVSSTDSALVQPWLPDIELLERDISRWLVSKIDRFQLECSQTFFNAIDVIELKDTERAVLFVTAALCHHRVIVCGTFSETVTRWVRTLAMFLSDERLLLSSDVCAEEPEQLVPDLHLQGTTCDIATFQDMLLQWRFPTCVIRCDAKPQQSVHYEPRSLSNPRALSLYREARFRQLAACDTGVASPASTSSLGLTPLRKKSLHVAQLWGRLQRNGPSLCAMLRKNASVQSLDRNSSHPNSARDVVFDVASTPRSAAGLPAGAASSSLVPVIINNASLVSPQSTAGATFTSGASNSRATVDANLIPAVISCWRAQLEVLALRHAHVEQCRPLRVLLAQSVPQETETDLFCVLMEVMPMELAEKRIEQQINDFQYKFSNF